VRARLRVALAFAAEVGEGLAEQGVGRAGLYGAAQRALARLEVTPLAVQVGELHPHLAVVRRQHRQPAQDRRSLLVATRLQQQIGLLVQLSRVLATGGQNLAHSARLRREMQR